MRLIFFCLFYCTTVLAQKIDPNFTKGLNAYNSDNPEKAVAYFEKVVKKNPNNAQAYLYIVKIKEHSFSGESTLNYLNKVIELDSTLAEAYHYRSINFEVDDLDAKIRDVSKAISLDPSNYGYYFNRSGFLIGREDYEGAIADAKKCFELVDAGAVSYMNCILAEAYTGLGKYDVALIYADKYINGDGDIDGYDTRGDIYFKMGNFQRALEDYSKFAQDIAQDMDIYGGYIFKKIGETQLNLEDKIGACISFQKAIDNNIEIDIELINSCK